MIKTILLSPPLSLEQRMGMLSEGGAIMPGLGILYIAAYLRKEKLPVIILDAEGRGLDEEATVNHIVRHDPQVLGITATTVSIISAVIIARRVKAISPNIKIFLGGPHVTALPRETMESFPEIDGCIIGDGEISFSNIIRNIESGNDLSDGVSGLMWRESNKISYKPKESHLEDLDSLPFPAWDLLDGFPEIYRPPFHSYRRLPVANIITTRGCPYACSFCDRSVFGKKLHSHSVEYVIAMIEYLTKNFGIREISIKDDMFIISKERVNEFCRQLNLKNLNIQWSCNARVNFITNEMLQDMKKAGCWMVSYGIESGSPEILKKMMKGITKEQVLRALRLSRKNRIVSKGFFMIGIPGETEETMQGTLDFIKDLPLDELNINFFTPFPGSQLYQEVLEEGFKPDYARMNMLDAVYVPKGLSEARLRTFQKKIIYAFYLKLSKISLYCLRALTDINECKRIFRMARMFGKVALSAPRKKSRRAT